MKGMVEIEREKKERKKEKGKGKERCKTDFQGFKSLINFGSRGQLLKNLKAIYPFRYMKEEDWCINKKKWGGGRD